MWARQWIGVGAAATRLAAAPRVSVCAHGAARGDDVADVAQMQRHATCETLFLQVWNMHMKRHETVVAMSIRDNNQQLDMRVLTWCGDLRYGIRTWHEYHDPCQRARKVSSELGLSDLEHGNETAVQTDSV